ncbi:MAG: flagellar basal body P-ring formation protein FlgA [Chitinivibrionales bacterium]|nr:flagellar basal body P-ring formation protein FlgA [Chitinivibrionales bacterium]
MRQPITLSHEALARLSQRFSVLVAQQKKLRRRSGRQYRLQCTIHRDAKLAALRHRYRNAVLILLLSAFFRLSFCQGASLVVTVRDSATICGDTIKLGDIATIRSIDATSVPSGVAGVTLGPAAPAGYGRYVRTDEVLTYYLPASFRKMVLRIDGPRQVKVNTAAQKLTVRQFDAIIADHIRQRLSWDSLDCSITILNSDHSFLCPVGPVTATVTGDINPFSRATVRVALLVATAGKAVSIQVLCNLKVMTPVVVAQRTIRFGETLQPRDLTLQRMDITPLRYLPYTDVATVAGTVAARTITEGTYIHRLCIKNKPDTYKGEEIDCQYMAGQIRLTLRVTARKDGVIGDLICVENRMNHKLFMAKIIAQGVVAARFSGSQSGLCFPVKQIKNSESEFVTKYR